MPLSRFIFANKLKPAAERLLKKARLKGAQSGQFPWL